ncbi:MAG TPA: hypothetical protein VGE26_01540, partial [Sphingobacteriaceae bacterium]
VLWIFLVIFLLNTVGNMFAKTTFEQTFAVITLLFSVLIWNILRKKKRWPKLFPLREKNYTKI